VRRPVPELTARLQGHTSTIFTEMTALAMRHGAVNLGQGSPDFSGPSEVLEVAVQAIRDGRNQYAPGRGVLPLREAIAAHQQRFHGLTYDPATELCVTAGATEALTAAIVGLCDVGDEVVAFAPTYDSYGAACAIAGAHLRTVVLRGDEGWTFDEAELRAAVTPRTRLLLLNTPHNPSGRVFTHEELALIAEVCRENDVVAVTDEVYEHLWFDGARHRSLATLDGMRDRTVVISSAGKTFSVTGWKVGWACAPAPLLDAVLAAKQWLSFSNATPMQFAIAHALSMDDAWFDGYREEYAHRRSVLLGALAEHGFDVTPPQGTYFATLDVAQLGAEDGLALCRAMPAAAGVAAIPLQVFYEDPADGRRWVRLAFCKQEDAMREGVARLAAHRDRTAA
jgi:N-succinyldiaminopimelate aminotransferase